MKYLILLLSLQLGLAGGALLAQETPAPTPDAAVLPVPEVALPPTPDTPVVTPATTSAEAQFEAKIESAVESLFQSSTGGGDSSSSKKNGISINIGNGDKKDSDKGDKSGISIHVDDDAGNKVVKNLKIAEILPELLVPIVALVMVFGSPVVLVGLVLLYRMKKNRLLHQTIQNLVANGQPIPPELLASSGAKTLPTVNSDRRRGIIFTLVGVGLIAYQIAEGDSWGIGLIPLMVGAGYLLTAKFAPRGGNNDGAKN